MTYLWFVDPRSSNSQNHDYCLFSWNALVPTGSILPESELLDDDLRERV